MLDTKAPRAFLRGKPYTHRAVENRGRRRSDSRRKLPARFTSSFLNTWGRNTQCSNTAHINATRRILTVNQEVARKKCGARHEGMLRSFRRYHSLRATHGDDARAEHARSTLEARSEHASMHAYKLLHKIENICFAKKKYM